MAITRPKGTNDLLPPGSPKLSPVTSATAHIWLTETARRVLERAGAQRIDTPIFEEAELVKRGVGDSTDIVRKEMFTVYYFGNNGGYIMRPEGTAGIVRAYLENGLKQLPVPLKLWTSGAMFRAERSQKGRYRQFHQVDYEVLGSADPLVDAEAIALMVDVVRELGLKEVRVKLGSIGDPADREAYNAYLRELFTAHHDRLSDDSKDRLTRNPMRILDSKSEGDQDLIAELSVKPMLDFLGEEARTHFEAVQGHLKNWGVPYDLDPSIVRGLDYYRRTAWELHHEGVGAKSALGGGGRYDGLAEVLGGPEVPGIGWAFGVERLLLALEAEGVRLPQGEGPLLYVVALDEENVPHAAELAMFVRLKGVRAESAYVKKNPSSAYKDAERRGAKYLAIIGSEEILGNYVTLKEIRSGIQVPIGLYTLLRIMGSASRRNNLFTNVSNLKDIIRGLGELPSNFIGTREYYFMANELRRNPRYKHSIKALGDLAENLSDNWLQYKIIELSKNINENTAMRETVQRYKWNDLLRSQK